MEPVVCCVCQKPIEGDVVSLGARSYCTACHGKVTRNRRSLWWASLLGLAVVVLVVAAIALVAGAINPRLEGGALAAVGAILAAVPALLWLAFFYLQDVREPEPKSLVLSVFLLGALLARAVGIPLVEDVFAVSGWLATGLLYRILGAILVVGFTQQFLVYAAVRYSVYSAAEFDERVDGITYGTAAGLGYATMVNIQFVVESGGIALAAGVIRLAVTALALASFGGVTGYFLGRCKFEDEPLWWMPAGLTLAAILDGLFTYALGEVTTTAVGLRGGGYNPWPGLVLGAVVAGATFGILFFLIRRLGRRAPQAAGA